MDKKILIVDDSKSWLAFHQEVINQLYSGMFEITFANSAMEAWDILRHNIETPFNIIITDLQMELNYDPKLAGEWLIEHIHSLPQYSGTKIIIISAMYNLEFIAKKLNVECISKSMLIHNKLLIKYMFEKLMPFLNNL